MGTLAAHDPTSSAHALVTWAEIRALYADQWLLVEDVAFARDGGVISARVLMHGIRRIDRVRLMARLRPQHPEVRDVFTGDDDGADALFVFKLAMFRSSVR